MRCARRSIYRQHFILVGGMVLQALRNDWLLFGLWVDNFILLVVSKRKGLSGARQSLIKGVVGGPNDSRAGSSTAVQMKSRLYFESEEALKSRLSTLDTGDWKIILKIGNRSRTLAPLCAHDLYW